MKNLLFFAMIISSFGCQTTSPSVQEQETSTTKEIGNDTAESPTLNPTSNPGEVTFTLEVLENYTTAKEICGASKENVVKISVIDVVKKGMGITNMPKPKDTILVHFIILPNGLEPNMQLQVRAKEFLCLDTSESYFTVISHKILE